MFSLNWFGGGNKDKQRDAAKKAIIDLREQLSMLQKREKHLEGQVAEQEAIARKYATTNVTIAKAALKRKKLHETSLISLQGQVVTLEQQIHSIESANINAETLRVMKDAGKAMQSIHSGMKIDDVETTMEQIQDQHMLAAEISEALSRGVATDAIDEGELEEELEAMQQESLDQKLLGAETAPSQPVRAPAAPVKVQPQKTAEEEEEEELRRLQAEMAA